MRLESEKMFLQTKTTVATFTPITFTANNSMQTWKVPTGIKKIHVDCVASQGGNSGGKGGRVVCDLAVIPGQTLYIMVGNVPSDIITAIYNASDIRIGGTEYANRVIVTGGGGSKASSGAAGGAGGGLTGGNGTDDMGTGGKGGTQTQGGDCGAGGKGNLYVGANGTLGLGGKGGNSSSLSAGAGGAGYYGGGGGIVNSGLGIKRASGGGGGSSYTKPDLCTNVFHTQGYRTGAGYITISMTN